MNNSPADIIRQFLVDEGWAADDGEWTAFTGFMPGEPDAAICVYDTAGKLDGRIMKTGEKIQHPGIQIQLRHPEFTLGFQRANSVAQSLDAQRKTVVALDTENAYIIHNVSRTSNVLHMGLEMEGDRRRHLFTINAVVTIESQDD